MGAWSRGARGLTSIQPIQLLECELGTAITPIAPGTTADGRPYSSALLLVRLGGRPVGWIRLSFEDGQDAYSPCEVAGLIWNAHAERIRRAAAEAGMEPPSSLSATGITLPRSPCSVSTNPRDNGLAVAVVVPTTGNIDRLARCLQTIEASQGVRLSLIVVYNRGTQTTFDHWLAAVDRNNVTVVWEPRPGVSWARNRGLAAASDSEFVVFMDDDVLVDSECIRRLVDAVNSDDRIGCATGLILPEALESPAQIWLQEYGGFDKGFDQRLFSFASGPADGPLHPYAAGVYGSGACMAFRTSVLLEIGGFRPALGSGSHPTGGEDLAVFYDTLRAGHLLAYEPGALVRHPHTTSLRSLRRRMFRYGVGLTAYLTALASDEPRAAVEFARRAPAALTYLFAPDSGKNHRKTSTYPRELTLAEWAGMIAGPFAYGRSRWGLRRHRHDSARVRGPEEPAV